MGGPRHEALDDTGEKSESAKKELTPNMIQESDDKRSPCQKVLTPKGPPSSKNRIKTVNAFLHRKKNAKIQNKVQILFFLSQNIV